MTAHDAADLKPSVCPMTRREACPTCKLTWMGWMPFVDPAVDRAQWLQWQRERQQLHDQAWRAELNCMMLAPKVPT